MPLPTVPVERTPVSLGADGALLWDRRWDPNRAPAYAPKPLPDEWVLRQLADADLDNDPEIVELLNEYGHIKLFGSGLSGELVQAVDDARWELKTVRALARMWANASIGEDATAVWQEEGIDLPDEADSWLRFVHDLNHRLRPFQARVDYHLDDIPITELSVDLCAAACQQIFNLIVAGPAARRCENETCGRLFVHQLGGAVFGQHRSRGKLRFCSPECARAETQRQYRRRKAAQRKERS